MFDAWRRHDLAPGQGVQAGAHREEFAAIKNLDRPVSAPTLAIGQAGPHELRVELQGPSHGYALLVHLFVPHESTRYSDNYVDLAPGDVRALTVTNATMPLSPEMVTLGWR